MLPAIALLTVGPTIRVAHAETPAPSTADGANGTGGQRVDGVPVPVWAVTGAVGSDALTDLFGLPPDVQRYRGELPVFRDSPTEPPKAFARGFPALGVNTAETSPSDLEDYQFTNNRWYDFRSASANRHTAIDYGSGGGPGWCYVIYSYCGKTGRVIDVNATLGESDHFPGDREGRCLQPVSASALVEGLSTGRRVGCGAGS